MWRAQAWSRGWAWTCAPNGASPSISSAPARCLAPLPPSLCPYPTSTPQRTSHLGQEQRIVQRHKTYLRRQVLPREPCSVSVMTRRSNHNDSWHIFRSGRGHENFCFVFQPVYGHKTLWWGKALHVPLPGPCLHSPTSLVVHCLARLLSEVPWPGRTMGNHGEVLWRKQTSECYQSR